MNLHVHDTHRIPSMKQRFTTARVLAGIIAAAATLGAARAPSATRGVHPPGTPQTTGEIRLILRGAQQGSLFTSNCGATSSGEFKAMKFTDLTDPNAPADVGTFSMDVPAACIAPLLTALYHHEALNGAIGFFDARGQPVLAFSLGSAYLAHVASSLDQASNQAPFVTIDIVSPAWTAFVPTSSAGGAWANPAATSSTGSTASPTASSTSSTASGAPSGTSHAVLSRTALRPVALATPRVLGVDLDALRAHRARLGAVVAAKGGSSGSGSSISHPLIASPYFTATLVGTQTAFPSPAFRSRDFGFDVRAPLGAHGESAGAPTTTILPIHAQLSQNAAVLMNAAQHHEPMRSATFVVASGTTGQPVLTVVPHAATLTGDHMVTATNGSEQELTFSLSGMTVTDATSGRTVASTP